MKATADRPAQPAGETIPTGLARQRRDRDRALRRLARLREKASAEIDRLINFLDASDPYAATELEQGIDDEPHDGDELEPSLCGVTADFGIGSTCPHHVDLEDDIENEPSLGWTSAEAARGRYAGLTPGRVDTEEHCEDEGVSV